jgi:hypothetical protein
LDNSFYIAKQCRDFGPRKTLGRSLDEVLQRFIPENAHVILNDRKAPVTVAFTEVSFGLKGHLVSHFESRTDLIDCLRASCNIPFFLEGNQLTVQVRGLSAIDGFFASSLHRFGTPSTSATGREIIVSPFATRFTKINPYKVRPVDSKTEYDIITPDLFLDRKTWPFKSDEIFKMALGMIEKNVSDEEITERCTTVYQGGVEAVNRWNEKRKWKLSDFQD